MIKFLCPLKWLVLAAIGFSATGFAQDLIRQTILPTEELKPDQTTLWSPCFQLCWDNLKEMHEIDAINLKPENPHCKYLNQFQWDSDKSLPPHDLITIVGESGPKFVETVNAAMLRHFGDKSNLLDPNEWKDPIIGGIAALTVLRRSVNFGSTFKAQKSQPFAFFNNNGDPRDVHAFGSSTPSQRKNNVGSGRVLSYFPRQKMALALKTEDPEEFVVVMRDPDLKSIMAAIKETKSLLESLPQGTASDPVPQDSYITRLDTIQIPQLKLSSFAAFQEQLKGKYTTPNLPEGYWRIARAIQNIDLSLNQSGADMDVRTFIVPPAFLSNSPTTPDPKKPNNPVPRNFVFNKPFFLMFWRKNATVPYLACYINTGGLVPWR